MARYTKAEKAEILKGIGIEESISTYSKRISIPKGTLYNWLKTNKLQMGEFVELEIENPINSTSLSVSIHNGGFEIRFSKELSIESLRALLGW